MQLPINKTRPIGRQIKHVISLLIKTSGVTARKNRLFAASEMSTTGGISTRLKRIDEASLAPFKPLFPLFKKKNKKSTRRQYYYRQTVGPDRNGGRRRGAAE